MTAETGPFYPGAGATPSDGPEDATIPAGLVNHPRYRILGVIGSGGMGTVFRAEHRLMGRVVALKVVCPHLASRPKMVQRFRREVRAGATLSHPNIVAAYDADQAGDTHFLVMEYVEGTDLDRLVEDEGALPAARACDYARQAGLGLQHAHERGMVHRDVKPHNLMLTGDEESTRGLIKVLDFGLARFLLKPVEDANDLPFPEGGEIDLFPEQIDEDFARAPTIQTRVVLGPNQYHYVYTGLGTADYVAPETIQDPRRADARADVYSLGCTLYRLLSGSVPFPGGDLNRKLRAHLHRRARPLTGVPGELAQIVELMMAKDPGDRPQTLAEVVGLLGAFVRGDRAPSRARQETISQPL